MHIYKTRRAGKMQIFLLVACFAAAVLIFTLGSGALEKNNDARQTELLEEAIENAIVSSYAIKGYYPDALDGLLEEYGITVDSEKYIVSYDVFAKNIRPTVHIYVIAPEN